MFKRIFAPTVSSVAPHVRSFSRPRLTAAQVKRQLEVVKDKINRASLAHGTNAEALIAQATTEPIVVDAHVAVCDGGGGALGHPIEFIQLNRVDIGSPEVCNYCGLKFKIGEAHGH